MRSRRSFFLLLSCLWGMAGCQPPPEVIVCEARPQGDAQVCEVTPGSDETRISGDILAPDAIYVGGELRIDAAGAIACVGCDCAAPGPAPTEITCPGAAVSPGLINLHEHLTFANSRPAADTGERYEHRHDWRIGLDGHTQIVVDGGNASAAERAWGELRHLFSGTTAMAGAGAAAGLVRNLDVASEPAPGVPLAFTDTFPLGDVAGEQLAETCAYPAIQNGVVAGFFEAYVPHLAEGIDANAENEFVCTRTNDGGGSDLLASNAALIHGMALGPADFAEVAAEGASLVWSPRSNTRLYGDTARVGVAERLGVTLALGTDWLPSGSMNLQRELVCAREWSDRSGSLFDARDLWRMVTAGPAEAVAAGSGIGTLQVGLRADVAIFASEPGRRAYQAATTAAPEDTLLVLRGGRVLYGDAAVVASLGDGTCDTLDVCGTSKGVCTQGEVGQTLAELTAAVGDAYPLFFCGTPEDEPSCHPARNTAVEGASAYTGVGDVTDWDGDGRSGLDDTCPYTFDPVRPMDGGTPPDADGDGSGDACDSCPLDPTIGALPWPGWPGGSGGVCAAL